MPEERAFEIKGDLCRSYAIAKGRKYALSYERKVMNGRWAETDRLQLPIYCQVCKQGQGLAGAGAVGAEQLTKDGQKEDKAAKNATNQQINSTNDEKFGEDDGVEDTFTTSDGITSRTTEKS